MNVKENYSSTAPIGLASSHYYTSLQSKSSDARTDDSLVEEVPANNLQEFSSDSKEDDQEIEKDPWCSSSCSENTVFSTLDAML
ncbi:hypothetical protein TNCV_1051251 [Trichonephila clavipes]|nr:hypothetical protein TNCV_1051251 [Trichonephila clavipes]